MRFVGFVFRYACATVSILLLSGCVLAPVLESDALKYHEAADVTANRIILLNILRAKDGAPLHFGELSLVHGSVGESGALAATLPAGEVPHSSSLPRANVAPSVTLSDQMTFDLGTLDTQAFTQGVTTAVSPKMLKYFLDSGMDHRLVLLLLLAGARPSGGHELIANFPRAQRSVCFLNGFPEPGHPSVAYEVYAAGQLPESCKAHNSEFFAFLRILNALPRIYAVSERPFVPVGLPFRPNGASMLHDLTTVDPGKQAVRTLPNGMLQFGTLAAEEKVVLCQEQPRAAGPARQQAGGCALVASGIGGAADRAAANQPFADFTMRSPFGIFTFLGQVVALEERAPERDGIDECITLGRPADPKRSCDDRHILFRLTHDRAHARFGVEYGGDFWGVPDVRPCLRPNDQCDHTLETLSMVSLLLNLHKSAKDIPSTPTVQLVP